MRWPLYLLASGSLFFVGLALLLASVGIATSARHAPIGRMASWIGALGVAVSAVPAPRALYVLFAAAFAAWHVFEAAPPGARRDVARGSLCACAVLLAGVEAPWWLAPRVPLAPSARLVVVGDSVSAGLGSSSLGTWPDRIGRNHDVSVVNLAQAGATTSSALRQVRAIPAGPTTVVVEIGGNDVLSGLPPPEYRKALASLLAAATAPDRAVVMLELPLLPLQNAYGEVQREQSRRYGVPLVPRRLLAEALTREAATLDGLHLSSSGSEWLADRLWEILRP